MFAEVSGSLSNYPLSRLYARVRMETFDLYQGASGCLHPRFGVQGSHVPLPIQRSGRVFHHRLHSWPQRAPAILSTLDHGLFLPATTPAPPRRFRLSPNSQRGGGTLSGISERRLGHRSGTLGTWSSALIKASPGAPESLLPGQDTVKRHASMHHEVGPHRTSILPAGALTPASQHP